MKRSPAQTPPRLTRDAERLIALSTGLADSNSLMEDAYWESEMSALALKLMETGHDATLSLSLDHAIQHNPAAHDVLAEIVESVAQSTHITANDSQWDIMLLAMPMVAWSRFSIPSGVIPADVQAAISAHLHAHILSQQARASLIPYLYSVDQLPPDFAGVRKLCRKLGEAAISGTPAKLDLTHQPETAMLLADVRFMLAGVAVPHGSPMFRWQEAATPSGGFFSREDCLQRWVTQGKPNLAKLLPGCTFDCLLPDAYFVACRESDARIRPYTIRAAVAFLETTLKTSADKLRAIVASVGEDRVQEYRISFTNLKQADVFYGNVWPLYGSESDDTNPSPRAEVEEVLRDCKIGEITLLPNVLAPEFCDDCGSPLFADPDAEMVHAELPEEVDISQKHYH